MQKQVEKKKYYVVRERAVPEVLLKVVEAKRLLESKRVATVQELLKGPESAAVLFTNIRTIFFLSTRRPRERPSPLSFRWTMSRGFYQWCCRRLPVFTVIS